MSPSSSPEVEEHPASRSISPMAATAEWPVVKRPLAGELLVIGAAHRDPATTAEERELAAASAIPSRQAEGWPGRRRGPGDGHRGSSISSLFLHHTLAAVVCATSAFVSLPCY